MITKRIFIYLIAVAFITSCFENKPLQWQWSGTVAIGTSKLNIGFTINTGTDGKQTCTMDVLEQGAKDIPAELAKNDKDSLCITIPMLKAVYNGRKLSDDSIHGVFTQNGIALPLNMKAGRVEPDPSRTPQQAEYKTEEVVFKNDAEGAELAGTLTYPLNFDDFDKGTVPVVLMVSGSGSQNRDEEIMGHKPFLVIADYLAKNGIASLRYDDRGVGGSKGPLERITTMNNMADASAGVAYLRSLGKFGKVGVLGHSEGGTIAFMMAADGKADFVISLAGSAACGIDVIVGQNEALMQLQGVPQKIIDDYAAALRIIYKDRVSGVKIAEKSKYIEEQCKNNGLQLTDALKVNLEKCMTLGGEWFTWFLGYNPAEAISKVTCPVMALNGKLDMQVLSKDNIPVIKKNLPPGGNNLIKEYDALNHLFQHCTAATALNYGAIKETISLEVLKDIVNWVNVIK